jgi:hypothetical protein
MGFIREVILQLIVIGKWVGYSFIGLSHIKPFILAWLIYYTNLLSGRYKALYIEYIIQISYNLCVKGHGIANKGRSPFV